MTQIGNRQSLTNFDSFSVLADEAALFEEAEVSGAALQQVDAIGLDQQVRGHAEFQESRVQFLKGS